MKNERDRLKLELDRCSERLKNLESAHEEYEDEIRILKSRLLNSDELEGYFSQLRDLENHKRELIEAIEASRKAEIALKDAKECLNSAKNWGTYDILGGGVLSTAAKHQKIDEVGV